jgi:transcriptional regulator GlxA family with amidase domain
MSNTLRVGVLLFEGFEELDAIGPYEVFGSAAKRGADWTVETLATEPTERVSGAYGLRVEPDSVLDAGADPDLDFLVVPGGGWNDGNRNSGARGAANDDDLLATVRALHDTGTTLVSVCTGGMVLAAAGVLEGRPAVTHHGALEDLRESGAEVVEARVVDDGDIVTAGGITAGIDCALWLVEREWGGDVAEAVATTMEYERGGDVHGG